jgi:hypothetical protein
MIIIKMITMMIISITKMLFCDDDYDDDDDDDDDDYDEMGILIGVTFQMFSSVIQV